MRGKLKSAICTSRLPKGNAMGRKQMSTPFIILAIFGVRLKETELDGEMTTVESAPVGIHWLHIRMINLRSREFEAQVITPSTPCDLASVNALPEVHFDGTFNMTDSWHLIQPRATQLRWYLRCCVLPLNHPRMLGTVVSNRCVAVELDP